MVAKDAESALNLLATNLFRVAFLDHDLGFMNAAYPDRLQGNGKEVARYMTRTSFPGLVVIHSVNESGAGAMKKLLKNATLAPFGTFEIKIPLTRAHGGGPAGFEPDLALGLSAFLSAGNLGLKASLPSFAQSNQCRSKWKIVGNFLQLSPFHLDVLYEIAHPRYQFDDLLFTENPRFSIFLFSIAVDNIMSDQHCFAQPTEQVFVKPNAKNEIVERLNPRKIVPRNVRQKFSRSLFYLFVLLEQLRY
jgi:hypothetical protein